MSIEFTFTHNCAIILNSNMENKNSNQKLFNNLKKKEGYIHIGGGFSIRKSGKKHVDIESPSGFYKRAPIKPQIEMRLLVIDLIQKPGVMKIRLAEALSISRQSIDNWLATYKKFGSEGLVNSYKGSREIGRKANIEKLPSGNKARQLEQERKKERETIEKQNISLNFAEAESEPGEEIERPDIFSRKHDFLESRYAGSFLYWAIFQHYFKFMEFIESHLGKYSLVVYLFAMMQINRIGSIEQLKTVFKKEFGRIVGLKKLFSLPVLWELIHGCVLPLSAGGEGVGGCLHMVSEFFKRQARLGIVSLYFLFIDGHFIPYSGKEDVHKGFYTQRGLAMPGQTKIFVHDIKGNIVYFEIHEGKGDIPSVLEKMSAAWAPYLGGISPLVTVDRELWSVKVFLKLKNNHRRFVTWEKYTEEGELEKISSSKFGKPFKVNDIEYQVYESSKSYSDIEKNEITLRRIVIWNKKTDKRMAVVAHDDLEDSQTISEAMLKRWGVNENGFKHMGNRLNMHYNPVLDLSLESERQEILNPEYKELEKKKKEFKKKLKKLEGQLEKHPLKYNKDGSLRKNKRRDDLNNKSSNLLEELKTVELKLSECPERIKLCEYKEGHSFKIINTEGKNLWDLAETLVWNSRKILAEELGQFLSNNRDLYPVLEAITGCRGWIKSTSEMITVKLEALETPRFRAAQIQLCRVLNEKQIRFSNGKLLQFDVKQ